MLNSVIDDLMKAADAATRDLKIAANWLADSPSIGSEDEQEEPSFMLLNALRELEFAVEVARARLSRPEGELTIYRYGDDEGGSGVTISDRGRKTSKFYID